MKVSKLITLDVEICRLLSKEPNASKLIQRLLKEYYELHEGEIEKKNTISKEREEGNKQTHTPIQEETART